MDIPLFSCMQKNLVGVLIVLLRWTENAPWFLKISPWG